MKTNSLQLLQLLRLVSQALPVGAYAYSQGMESAVEEGYVTNAVETRDWIAGILPGGPGQLDLPILIRQYQSWQANNISKVLRWNMLLAAFRETSELLLEDQQMGRALYRLLNAELLSGVERWPDDAVPCYVTMFALAGASFNIELKVLLNGFVWSWMENQVSVATKLIPLGQSAAQRILVQLLPEVEAVCDRSLEIPDDDIGFSMPGLAILSSNHEQLPARLFRS